MERNCCCLFHWGVVAALDPKSASHPERDQAASFALPPTAPQIVAVFVQCQGMFGSHESELAAQTYRVDGENVGLMKRQCETAMAC